MKNLIITTFITFLLLSCSESTTIQDSEALRIEAFSSKEFKTLQATYNDYIDIEASITEVFDKNKTGKLTNEEKANRKDAYIKKITEKMFEVKRKKIAFLSKYPSIGVEINEQGLIDLLRGKEIR